MPPASGGRTEEDPAVTQIHLKRVALGEADGQTPAGWVGGGVGETPALSLCWQNAKRHVDPVPSVLTLQLLFDL